MDIKALDRITVRGYEDKDRVNVVKYNNELYCIDDPLLLDKVKDYRVIAEVNNQKELWKHYIENNIRNCLDPFKILLLYKEGVITEDILPNNIRKLLEDCIEIDNSILEGLERYIRELEANTNKPILLHITILIGIRDAIKRLQDNSIDININDIVHDLTNTEGDTIHLPNAKAIKVLVEKLVEDKEEREDRDNWEAYKQRRDSYIAKEMEGSKASIAVIEENKEEENNDISTNEDKSEEEEGYEPIEEKKFSKVELKILLLYPEEQRERIMKFIEKIKNATSKFCRKNGIEIGEM
ncbi:MAG: hypothetical protein KatS3mg003_1895 [Candidatus Nitrosocaldaceae archaeon]|nr:MAG: hypothetical protein KatS3mg003_1895 [Candidatus Nitrosocaldaceae archaeon]